MSNIFKTTDIALLCGRNILFDTNVIIYLFWPTAFNFFERAYASLFSELLKQKNNIFVDFTIISETVNRIIRIEYEKYLQEKNLNKDALKFKDYRNGSEGREVLDDIYQVINNKILKRFSICGKFFNKTDNLTRKNIEKIAELFPNVITEAKDENGYLIKAVDFDLLKQELSNEIIESEKERYQLTWPGKKEAIVMANMPINKTLRPAKEESVDWDKTQNIYIEGDNLEVLKILQESYLNSVKCIYIDPPYNTGKDFVYKDNFSKNKDEYNEESGQIDEEGNRLFQNTESNGRFHSDSTIKKRQEVGRGLRLCVNKHGDRIDSDVHGVDVHDINILTVIASESYDTFAKQLQSEIAETLSDRPQKADVKFFVNKIIKNARGDETAIGEKLAAKIYRQMIKKDYIDDEDNLTQTYFDDVEKNAIEFPVDLEEYKESLVGLIKTIYVEGKTNFVSDERKNNIAELRLNDNFKKKEFQELWNKINHKSVYTVSFDTKELIDKCINALNAALTVSEIQFKIKHGELGYIESKEQLKHGEAFKVTDTQNDKVEYVATSGIKYDLIGKMINETKLTRKTIVAILKGISPKTFLYYRKNPEEFIMRASRIINEQKATTIIERITYDPIEEQFDTSIFTWNTLNIEVERNVIPASKHICDYVVTDSKVEKEFAKSLEAGKEVCVFAKLPRGFYIPTPVGDYNPDWAIVLKENDVKYVYFIAETKGTMETLELREVEKAKIHCARKHFEKLNCKDFKYDVVDNYQRLMDLIK